MEFPVTAVVQVPSAELRTLPVDPELPKGLN